MARCVRALTYNREECVHRLGEPFVGTFEKGESQRVRVAEEERIETRVEKRHEKGQTVESAVPV